ncbi:MAG: ElaA protein [Pseudohongiellaceae bacterium]|jgi:ElaA protein
MINWQCLPFSQLSTHQLYDLLKLRVDVFVVEQNCPYHELDNKDRAEGAYHLLGVEDDTLVAYARLLTPGISFDNASFGRVVTHSGSRGNGLGTQLLNCILEHCQQLWPNQSIDIGAQEPLKDFYGRFGFTQISNMYLDDGIPHINMRLCHD